MEDDKFRFKKDGTRYRVACGHDESELCQECCEHSDIDEDHMMCIDCDKDMSADILSGLIDREKDRRKYGE